MVIIEFYSMQNEMLPSGASSSMEGKEKIENLYYSWGYFIPQKYNFGPTMLLYLGQCFLKKIYYLVVKS